MAKRELRSAGSTTGQTLDSTKNYKYNSSGVLVESTGTPGGTDIVFTGSKSSLRRLADLERNVSILAAKTLTDDNSGSGYSSSNDYSDKAGRWASSRTITLGGDLSGSVSIDGSSNVTLNATVAGNTVALGTDTTGNYMVNVTAGTGISVSHTQGEGSTATITNSLSTSGGSIGGAIAVTGGITATGEITAYYSDDRLKKDVVAITDPIQKLMQIRGVTFRPNATALALGITDKEEVGVIAQEIQAVLPQLVTGSAFEGYVTVKYDKLTALLIEAVKAQQKQIDDLKALVARTGGGI